MKLDNVIAVRPNKIVYKDGDKTVKVFNEDFSQSDILNEALNQSRVQETGLPIPKVLEVTKIDGKWAIVLEHIEGKTLQQMMEENPTKEDEYLERFVNLQLMMHAKRAPLLNKWKDKMTRKIHQAELSATVKYELNARLSSLPTHNKLCHGDFNPSNVICGTDGVDYIIDWSHATQGNASADVARTYLLFHLQGTKKLADKYLKLFCERSNTARQYVEKWLPIVAASQSVKGKKEEQSFLLKWIDICDFE